MAVAPPSWVYRCRMRVAGGTRPWLHWRCSFIRCGGPGDGGIGDFRGAGGVGGTGGAAWGRRGLRSARCMRSSRPIREAVQPVFAIEPDPDCNVLHAGAGDLPGPEATARLESTASWWTGRPAARVAAGGDGGDAYRGGVSRRCWRSLRRFRADASGARRCRRMRLFRGTACAGVCASTLGGGIGGSWAAELQRPGRVKRCAAFAVQREEAVVGHCMRSCSSWRTGAWRRRRRRRVMLGWRSGW